MQPVLWDELRRYFGIPARSRMLPPPTAGAVSLASLQMRGRFEVTVKHVADSSLHRRLSDGDYLVMLSARAYLRPGSRLLAQTPARQTAVPSVYSARGQARPQIGTQTVGAIRSALAIALAESAP